MAYNLKAELEHARGGKRINFLFFKGTKEEHFLASKKKVAKALIDGLNDGKPTKTVKGLCYFDGQDLVCESKADVSSSVSLSVKSALMEKGVTVGHVVFKKLNENDPDEVSDESEGPEGDEEQNQPDPQQPQAPQSSNQAPPIPPPPPVPPTSPAQDEGAALLAALNKISPMLKQAVSTHPELKEEILGPVAAFQAHLKAHEYSEAKPLLVEMVNLLKSLGGPRHTPEALDAFHKEWTIARKEWRDASDAVDAQIDKLQNALRTSNDAELVEIGEFGLNGVTGDFKVPLIACMREIDSAEPEMLRPLAAKARGLISGFTAHIDSEERITACDQNPFGVPVSIRNTIKPALAKLDKVLAAA